MANANRSFIIIFKTLVVLHAAAYVAVCCIPGSFAGGMLSSADLLNVAIRGRQLVGAARRIYGRHAINKQSTW